jgi:hypothetical protein
MQLRKACAGYSYTTTVPWVCCTASASQFSDCKPLPNGTIAYQTSVQLPCMCNSRRDRQIVVFSQRLWLFKRSGYIKPLARWPGYRRREVSGTSWEAAYSGSNSLLESPAMYT